MKVVLALFAAVLLAYGCAAAFVGGVAYHSAKSREAQQEFMTGFHATNTEREARGLEPLDWCTEAYRFDKGWAKRDKACRKRIVAYEAGDTTALGQPITQNEIDEMPEPPRKKAGNKYRR